MLPIDKIIELSQVEHTKQLIVLEAAAAARVTGQLRREIEEANRRLLAGWVLYFGNVTDEGSGPALQRLLRTFAARVAAAYDKAARKAPPVVAEALQAAQRLGIEQALEILGIRQASRIREPQLRSKVADDVPRLLGIELHKLEQHIVGIRGGVGTELTALMSGLSIAGPARLDRAIAWETETGVTEGSTQVAKQLGTQKLWIAERDGCLTCLAYSGEVVDAHGTFPAGLTFGTTSTLSTSASGPPAHPHCRCSVVPYAPDGLDREGVTGVEYAPGQRERAQLVDLPTALKREARRSVAKGFSAYDSNRQRVNAADRLLQRGADLPKTVEQQARRDIKRGNFRNTLTVNVPTRGRVIRNSRLMPTTGSNRQAGTSGSVIPRATQARLARSLSVAQLRRQARTGTKQAADVARAELRRRGYRA
jgi:hypothetical protein